MKYCVRCVLPDSRPNLTIDEEGVCSACRGHDEKVSSIDWDRRRRDFEDLVRETKAASNGYDCIVPVSGGKDSWYQVIQAQEWGLRVLGVTWRTPGRTAVGQRNLDRLIDCLGIDHIDYSISPSVERRFTRLAFELRGASGIPMHMAIFAIPLRLASQLGVPLVLWGENPQLEFGGDALSRQARDLDLEWIRRYGVTNKTDVNDWVGDELTAEDLLAYRIPDGGGGSVPHSVFLGSYFAWDSFRNAQVAMEHGFEADISHRRTGVWHFADIDCSFVSVHHFLKWYKFGFTRAFDNVSAEIRYGRLSRDEALELLREIGLQIPTDDIESFCEFVERPLAWFWDTAERFRNRDIWAFQDGAWRIPGFVIKEWKW